MVLVLILRRLLQNTQPSTLLLFVGCLMSQQLASVSQIRSDNFNCCHTKTEFANQTFYLTQSQHTDIGPTSLSADPITSGAWQGSMTVPIFKPLVWLDPEKSHCKPNSNPGSSALKADDLTTRPTRWSAIYLLLRHKIRDHSTWILSSCTVTQPAKHLDSLLWIIK